MAKKSEKKKAESIDNAVYAAEAALNTNALFVALEGIGVVARAATTAVCGTTKAVAGCVGKVGKVVLDGAGEACGG